jgi:hypothetical protein
MQELLQEMQLLLSTDTKLPRSYLLNSLHQANGGGDADYLVQMENVLPLHVDQLQVVNLKMELQELRMEVITEAK